MDDRIRDDPRRFSYKSGFQWNADTFLRGEIRVPHFTVRFATQRNPRRNLATPPQFTRWTRRTRQKRCAKVAVDIAKSADMIMVKPAPAYLDIIHGVKDTGSVIRPLPTAVSAESSMIKAAAADSWIDERAVTMEDLLAMRRSGGADILITAAAMDVARWLKEKNSKRALGDAVRSAQCSALLPPMLHQEDGEQYRDNDAANAVPPHDEGAFIRLVGLLGRKRPCWCEIRPVVAEPIAMSSRPLEITIVRIHRAVWASRRGGGTPPAGACRAWCRRRSGCSGRIQPQFHLAQAQNLSRFQGRPTPVI